MLTSETQQANVEESLRAQIFMARNRIADLEAHLALANQVLGEIHDRLALDDTDLGVLAGHADGSIRISELRPILQRLLGDAA